MDYKKWKRKNVTFRGMQEMGEFNGGSAILGNGLYTAALSNKAMAKGYGKVYFVVGGVPKNPKVFNTLNDWEVWFYNTLITQYTDGFPDKRKFLSETTIEAECQKLGFDGIVIKGRETVHFCPKEVLYFENEYWLQEYYESHIKNA